MKMKVFTIENGKVTEGAKVETFTLSGAGVTIPAILVGEQGRGRQLGVLPVQLLPEKYQEWQEKGEVTIYAAEVGQTRAGKPKLIEASEVPNTGRCVCVFRTKIGFRGSNEHTGDRDGGTKEKFWGEGIPTFRPFPGEIITTGRIAQGDAGRMGSGDQIVAVMPAGVVFRTGYSGRLYGAPAAHYYIYKDGQILSATWEERQISDIF